jgi:hypothetical protein
LKTIELEVGCELTSRVISKIDVNLLYKQALEISNCGNKAQKFAGKKKF